MLLILLYTVGAVLMYQSQFSDTFFHQPRRRDVGAVTIGSRAYPLIVIQIIVSLIIRVVRMEFHRQPHQFSHPCVHLWSCFHLINVHKSLPFVISKFRLFSRMVYLYTTLIYSWLRHCLCAFTCAVSTFINPNRCSRR